jgi:hypothetical protein
MACGDFGLFVGNLKWGSWGARHAKGHGKLWAKECKPSCATGPFRKYPVKVRLSGRREERCGGRRVEMYQRMRLRFPHREPHFADRIDKTDLFCLP